MIFKIKTEELQKLNGVSNASFPKYTSQLINWANQNAQGTRPKVVGQLSELFNEYQKNEDSITVDTWKTWYLNHYPNAIESATEKIYTQMQNLKEAIKLIDREMIREWVEDLVISKTFNGLYFQNAILSKMAKMKNTEYRLATPAEEAVGIDGYVGNIAYSVKPYTYKSMNRLSEKIDVKMIYYTKNKSGIEVEAEDD